MFSRRNKRQWREAETKKVREPRNGLVTGRTMWVYVILQGRETRIGTTLADGGILMNKLASVGEFGRQITFVLDGKPPCQGQVVRYQGDLPVIQLL